jgi:hypothetical protein
MYDYGMGGLWAYLWARNTDEIRRLFPELQVFDKWPDTMSEATRRLTEEKETYDIDDDRGRGILSVILNDRDRG